MKKLSTKIVEKNATERVITVNLENELADWLVTQSYEIYRDFILSEYRSRCVERKETRYVQSLDKLFESGYAIPDDTEEDLYRALTRMDLEQALSELTGEQQWLIRQIYYLGRSRVDVARSMGLTEGSVRSRLHTILKKLKDFLN